MTRRERVRAALTWRRPDRVPVGEFALAGQETTLRRLDVGLDAVGVIAGSFGWRDRLTHLAGPDGGGAFVWVVVDGPFQGLAAELGLEGALRAVCRSGLAGALRERTARAAARAREALELGADGIVIGEDIAHGGGLMLPWRVVAGELGPLWAGLVEDIRRGGPRRRGGLRRRGGSSGPGGREVPPEDTGRPLTVFHCDSATLDLIELAAETGFDAFHPLEPGPGLTVRGCLERFQGRLGLWGGLPLDLLIRDGSGGDDLETVASGLGRAGRAGGLVIGSTSGVVPAWVPAERLARAYAVATAAPRIAVPAPGGA